MQFGKKIIFGSGKLIDGVTMLSIISATKMSFRLIGYKSALALSNLYPESTLNIKTLEKVRILKRFRVNTR